MLNESIWQMKLIANDNFSDIQPVLKWLDESR